MSLNVHSWSTTASTNASADSGINWAEGMLPGTVNDSARGTMAAISRLYKDANGTLATTGSSNAYLLTSNSDHASLSAGLIVSITANHTNTGAATLNLNSIGVKAIRVHTLTGDSALLAGNIMSGGHYLLQYDTAANSAAGAWMLLNPTNPLMASDGALAVPSQLIVTSTAAAAFAVGRQGSTNAALQVNTVTASSVTGLLVTSLAAGNRVILGAISSGTNEGLDIDAKGSGSIRLGVNSTGVITLVQNASASGTFGVTGATTLGSTLAVTGAATFSSTLAVNGNTTLGDASGDSVTFNASTVATPNDLSFDSGTLKIDAANNRVGIGQTSPTVPLHIGGNTDSFSSDSMVNVSRAVDNTGSGYAHCYSDSSTITRTAGGPIGYNSADYRPSYTGTATHDHYAGVQVDPTWNSSGTISNVYCYRASMDAIQGTVTTWYGFLAENPTSSGTITNIVGMQIGPFGATRATNITALYCAGDFESKMEGKLTLSRGTNATTSLGTGTLILTSNSGISCHGGIIVGQQAYLATSSGSVGIGTTSPGAKLDIETSSADVLHVERTADAAGWVALRRGGSERGLLGWEASGAGGGIVSGTSANGLVLTATGDLHLAGGSSKGITLTATTVSIHKTLGAILTTVAPGSSTASINLNPGGTPSSPNDGDMWYDGSNIKFRNGASTKTITWS